jgi:hypothetical protein
MKMKKIITIIAVLFTSTALQAQQGYNALQDSYFVAEVFKNATILFLFSMIGVFVITIMRLSFDHRLKTKMIEKGVSENLAAQFLKSNSRNLKNEAMKWFFIFAGIGVGLGIVRLFQPYGVHSLAIIALSISAGFLAYYLFIRRAAE